MSDFDKKYRDALLKCAVRYNRMVYLYGNKPSELVEFIPKFIVGIPILPLCKLNRWLGYIQGTLIANNITSVEIEREWTGPLFRPLDYPESEGEKEAV